MSSTRPRRRLRSLAIAVLVLACLGFIADRVAESVAEDRLATIARNEAAGYDVRASDTSVEVGGVAFLPQLVRGKFDRITLTMRQATISSVPAEDLSVTMTGIRVPRDALTGGNRAAVRADSADLRLRMSPDALTKLASRSGLDGLTLRIVDRQLQARVAIRGIDVSATVRPQVQDSRIKLVVADLSADVPPAIRGALTSLLARGIQVPRLPFHATLKQVAIDGQSVVLTATATNLGLSAAR